MEASNNLKDVFFDEDYGHGEIIVHNTKIDGTVIARINPLQFENPNEARDLINNFCEQINKLKINKNNEHI